MIPPSRLGDYSRRVRTRHLLIAGLAVLVSCGGSSSDTGLDATVGSIAVQEDGQIVVGGGFTTPASSLARFGPDGRPDKAFNANVGVTLDSSVYAVAVQMDGKIVVGGYFSTPAQSLARFNPDGTPDEAFNLNVGTNFAGGIMSIDVLSDGRIVVGGQITAPSRSLARVNADGTMDTPFNTTVGQSIDLPVASVAILDDGSYVIGGTFTTPSPALARIRADGVFDQGFADNVAGSVSGFVSTIERHRDGIIIGGQFTSPANSIARFDLDGRPDDAFNATYQAGAGALIEDYVEKVAILDDDSILVGGWFSEPAPSLIRLSAEGELEPLPVQPAFDGAVLSVYGHATSIIVAGAFTVPARHLVILDY